MTDQEHQDSLLDSRISFRICSHQCSIILSSEEPLLKGLSLLLLKDLSLHPLLVLQLQAVKGLLKQVISSKQRARLLTQGHLIE